MIDEVNGIVGDAAASAALHFEATLKTTIGSALSPSSQISADVFRPDVPYANATTYYNSPAGISAAGSVVPEASERSGGDTITINHSTWLLANNTDTAAPTLTADQLNTVQRTQYVDEIFRTAYQLNPAVRAIYTGYSNGIFRRLPGTMRQLAFGPYDPINRPWYKDAVQYMQTSNYTIADPYLSTSDRNWIMTFSSPVRDPVTNAFLGVSAADMEIRVVSNTLKSFSINGLTLSLFLLNTGQAVSHPQWDISTQTAFTRKDASQPPISDAIWVDIQKKREGHAVVADPTTNTAYALVWSCLTLTNGKQSQASTSTQPLPPTYVAIGTTPIADLQSPIDTLRADTRSILARTTAITAIIFAVFTALLTTLVLWTATITTRPLRNLSNESAKITQNIGTPDLFAGVCEGGVNGALGRRANGGTEETKELEERFYETIRTIREGSVKKRDANDNVFFSDGRLPKLEGDAEMSVDLLPDAPPGYHAGEGISGGPSSAGSGDLKE
ncbi:hypothetical protein HK097_005401 [Rhizophlyctis rosea]|uniref:Uncharacterized protein n=1 Tax=Rhizophlyctis rosea TaxID=64517 RepID=A0AAD5SDH5_9FUNG|nr:hypothetical protein HK097_005401 [Rhizophlyctis rosea]